MPFRRELPVRTGVQTLPVQSRTRSRDTRRTYSPPRSQTRGNGDRSKAAITCLPCTRHTSCMPRMNSSRSSSDLACESTWSKPRHVQRGRREHGHGRPPRSRQLRPTGTSVRLAGVRGACPAVEIRRRRRQSPGQPPARAQLLGCSCNARVPPKLLGREPDTAGSRGAGEGTAGRGRALGRGAGDGSWGDGPTRSWTALGPCGVLLPLLTCPLLCPLCRASCVVVVAV